MHTDSEGLVRIQKREFIGDLQTAQNGAPIFYRVSLQPGDVPGSGVTPMAPWLETIAKHWQKYAFMGLAFEYIPTSSTFSTAGSPALGSVSMGISYGGADVNNPSRGITSKLSLLNLEGAVSGSPASSLLTAAECAPDETVIPIKFVRDLNNSNGSSRFYDLGMLHLLITGTPVGDPGQDTPPYVCGELWCTYDVVLMATKLPVSNGYKPPALFLPEEFKQVYRKLHPLVEGFPLIGRSSQEWLEVDLANAEALAVLDTPSAKMAWTRAVYESEASNSESCHMPDKDRDTPRLMHLPTVGACPPDEGHFVVTPPGLHTLRR
jgi:hypothetical protein